MSNSGVQGMAAYTAIKIQLARLAVRLGWPGSLGLLLLVTAGGLMHAARVLESESGRAIVSAQQPRRASASPAGRRVLQRPLLPRSSDAPALLAQIHQAALTAELNWSQASYRLVPISDDVLSSLEIRSTIKGPYPAIRKWITHLLNDQPALGVRELSFKRVSVDSTEVEADVTLMVVLGDGWAEAEHADMPALPASESKAGAVGTAAKDDDSNKAGIQSPRSRRRGVLNQPVTR